MESYKELKVWQSGVEMAVQVYQHTQAFPVEERFGLTSQARRAAVSVPANIAEGWGRASRRDYIKFLVIARGSLMELETHLILANRLGFLAHDDLAKLSTDSMLVGKMLNALITSLRNTSDQALEARIQGIMTANWHAASHSNPRSPTPDPRSLIPNPQPLP